MINNQYLGIFISIDGIDGSGKSSQINFIKKYFLNKNFKVFSGHEPTNSKFGKTIHKILFGKLPMPKNLLEFQKLYIKDRKEHLLLDVIPSLSKEKSVYISDRYFLSTLAYGMAGGVGFNEIMSCHEQILNKNFIIPDIMFVLDVEIELSFERLEKMKGENMDLFEKKKEFLERVLEKFLFLEEKFDNIYIINANDSKLGVSKQIEVILNKKFNF